MAFQRKLVLLGAGDSPCLDHEFGAFAHRQAGSRLRDTRQDRPQIARAQSKPWDYAFAKGLAAITSQQELLKTLGEDYRRITYRIDSGRNRAIYLAEGDLVGERNRSL